MVEKACLRRRSPGIFEMLDDPAQGCEEANMDLTPPEHNQQRCLLRGTWQLASVFHFLNVFRSVLNLKLKFSMEELETALLVPNALLDDIHIGLLKAIPPNSRNPINQETWIAVLCKKLKDWWHSVAEGPFPLIAQHRDEIVTYKDLSPDVRVIILKALCEARLEQEDMRAFICEMAKQETSFLSIRKERTGTDMQGATYWYENDPIAGQRLYRELQNSDKDKAKLRGHLVSPPATSQWETLATNLDEFQSVVDKLCSSRNKLEVVLGKKINIDIVPDLINAEKRKERMLRKQLRQAVLLDNSFKTEGVATCRSRRERKPVSYTFDDYDNSINEALEVMKVMDDSKLSNGSARQDSDKEVDEKTGTEATLHPKSESMEAATHSSKSDSFSNGRGGRNSVPWKITKSDSSDAAESDADALSGYNSEGEADRLLNKRRRLVGSSGAGNPRSKEMKEDFDYDVKVEKMEFFEGERNLSAVKRRGKLQVTEEPQECLAQTSRGTGADANYIKHESEVDSKRSQRTERDEMACIHKKVSTKEELDAESLGKSKVSIEEGRKFKHLQTSKVALRTAKLESLDD